MSDRAAFERERLVSIIIDKGMMRRDVACDVADAILLQQSANIHRAAGVLDAPAGCAGSTSHQLTEETPMWQPIETAPKNGHFVIIAVPVSHGNGWVIGEAGYYPHDGSDTGWWWANTSPGDYHVETVERGQGQPTHWMPLPAPPETK